MLSVVPWCKITSEDALLTFFGRATPPPPEEPIMLNSQPKSFGNDVSTGFISHSKSRGSSIDRDPPRNRPQSDEHHRPSADIQDHGQDSTKKEITNGQVFGLNAREDVLNIVSADVHDDHDDPPNRAEDDSTSKTNDCALPVHTRHLLSPSSDLANLESTLPIKTPKLSSHLANTSDPNISLPGEAAKLAVNPLPAIEPKTYCDESSTSRQYEEGVPNSIPNFQIGDLPLNQRRSGRAIGSPEMSRRRNLAHSGHSGITNGAIEKRSPKNGPRHASGRSVHTRKPDRRTFGILRHLEQAFQTAKSAIIGQSEVVRKQASDVAAKATVISALAETNRDLTNLNEEHQKAEGKLHDNQKKQAKRAAEMKKYLNGLGNDYAKIKEGMKTMHQEYRTIVENEIEKMKEEHSTLHDEFLKTIEVLESRHRKMKNVMNESYLSWRLSESVRVKLQDEVKQKEALIEEERKKREGLEQQLLCSVQSMQRRLEDNNQAVLEKIGTLKIQADEAVTEEGIERLNECRKAIETLCATRFLTPEDLEKTEDRLRAAHET